MYSLAEHQSGHATSIWVEARDQRFSVEDDGRGHAIARTVGSTPYVRFIYNHLEYPFESSAGQEVQLQGIGMTLLNTLCSELTVRVRKQDTTLHMEFSHGQLLLHQVLTVSSDRSGNAVSGQVAEQLDASGVDNEALEAWLLQVLLANPSLRLSSNGRELTGCTSGGA